MPGWDVRVLDGGGIPGKILRGTMRRIADGEEYATPATIDDPAVLDEMADALRRISYAQPQPASVHKG